MSNLSAVAIQQHGDAAIMGRRSCAQVMLLAQSGKTSSSRPFRACLTQEVRKNRMSPNYRFVRISL
jgi:hypothetical protein